MPDSLATDCPSPEESLEAIHRDSFVWALSCCNGSHSEAEEILQMSYVKYYGGKVTFGGRSSFKTWWFGVVRVTAHEHRRRTWLRWFRFLPLEDSPDRPTSEAGPDQLAERGELVDTVQSALSRLSTRQREILSLVFMHDLRLDEAATIAGISSGSAHVHYQRGKQRMRELLHPHLPEHSRL